MKQPSVRYCTYFNINYLLKGLAMIYSLVRNDSSAEIDVLCMDKTTKKIIDELHIHGVTTHRLSDFEDKELLKVKKTRSLVEYYWTCTPSLPLYIFKLYPNTQIVFYLDADLYFYSTPATMIKEMGNNSIYVVEHRYPKNKRHINNISGRFNVAINGFRRDREGMACLNLWREQCLDWCYHRYEKGRMGDQLYLNEWPKLYRKLKMSKNLGVNAAPWNISNYQIEMRSGSVFINNFKLVAYHFHQLEYYSWIYTSYAQGYSLSSKVVKNIYMPYTRELTQIKRLVSHIDPTFSLPALPPLSVRIKDTVLPYVENLIKAFKYETKQN